MCDRFFFFFFFFFNPTIEVVTFRPSGWCMLGVFLLQAFTRLGHECYDLLSPRDGIACVHRQDLGLFSHPNEFPGNGVKTHVNSEGKIPLYRKLRGRSNPRRCITQDSEPITLLTEPFWPQASLSTLPHVPAADSGSRGCTHL